MPVGNNSLYLWIICNNVVTYYVFLKMGHLLFSQYFLCPLFFLLVSWMEELLQEEPPGNLTILML